MIELNDLIVDASLILEDDGKYYELNWGTYISDGLDSTSVLSLGKENVSRKKN